MWIPRSIADLQTAIDQGLQESPWFDAKREFSSTPEAAKDIAAMANDGGVLVYGMVEDEEGTLVDLDAIEELKGLEERVANAVRDLLHNPPAVHIRELEDPETSGSGYLVVVVPKSPLAPHMVEGRREGRYYGRTGTTTSRLTGAQVDLLMQRRLSVQEDADAALTAARQWWGHFTPSDSDVGQLTILVYPTVPAGRLTERAAGENAVASYLSRIFRDAINGKKGTALHVLEYSTRQEVWQIGADRFFTAVDWDQADPDGALEVEIGRDGRVAVRSRGVVQLVPDLSGIATPVLVCDEWHAGSLITATLTAAGRLFADSREPGQVRCSLELVGLEGAISSIMRQHRALGGLPRRGPPPVREDAYRRHREVTTFSLGDEPEAVARDLFKDLFEALAQGRYPQGEDPVQL